MDESTISFLNNYLTELKKTHLDRTGKEMVRTIEAILRKEVRLQSELEELRSKHDDIISMSRKRAVFHSHELKETDRYSIEDLNLHRNRSINDILNTATNMIIRSERR